MVKKLGFKSISPNSINELINLKEFFISAVNIQPHYVRNRKMQDFSLSLFSQLPLSVLLIFTAKRQVYFQCEISRFTLIPEKNHFEIV